MLGAYFSVNVAPKIGELVQVLIELPEKVTRKQPPTIVLQQESFMSKDRPVSGTNGVGVNFTTSDWNNQSGEGLVQCLIESGNASL
jgi:hypothetical protein